MTDSTHESPMHGRIRTPTILQMEAVECGAASLAIILAHYGRIVPLEELRVECGVTRDGSNAMNLLKAARKFGLECKGYKKKVSTLMEMKPPFIIFWNFYHFLVLDGFGQKTVYLNDPAMGPRTVGYDEFDESYTGVVMTFAPGPDFKKGGSKPSMIRALMSRLEGSWTAVGFACLTGFALVVPGLALPAISQLLVDEYLLAGSKSWFRPLLFALVITGLVRLVLTWLEEFFLLRLETKIALTNSGKFLWHILRLPIEFYTQRYGGEISARVDLNEQIAGVIANRLAGTVIDMLMIVFYGGVLLLMAPIMLCVALVSVFTNVTVNRLMKRSMVDSNLRMQQEGGKMIGTSMAGLYNIETVKATAGESEFFQQWSGYHAKYALAAQDLSVKSLFSALAPAAVSGLTDLAVIGFGALLIMDSRMTMGTFVAVQTLIGSFIGPVNKMLNLATAIRDLEVKMVRIDDVVNCKVEIPANEVSTGAMGERGALIAEKLSGRLEMKDITFGYSHLEEPLIRGFNLTVEPGRRVAIVGFSGCGKSTLAKLITGLFKTWGGEILFDGHDRATIPRSVLTTSVALVDQEVMLFSGTIRDNISLWDRTMPESDVLRAGRDAVIDNDIAVRPGGYDSKVEEGGSNFSGGQRQRLEIARALALNPRILVLDEATSALDTVTEQALDRNLRIRGCTCIIIAHRLSTIRDADEIIVLDEGLVVQRGTHEALLAEHDSYYARLVGEI